MNVQGQRSAEIPGLFSAENTTNVDWSNDAANNSSISDPANTTAQSQNSMILLGGKSLLTDLTLEKDNLDQNFVHSHRLLDLGRLLF